MYSWTVKSHSPQTQTVLFEPLPAHQALIRHTVSRNQLSGVSLVAAAVSDRVGRTTLRLEQFQAARAPRAAEFYPGTVRDWGKAAPLEVALATIDSERARRGPVDLLKIHVKGCEASVITGGMDTIRYDQPVVFVRCLHPQASCLSPLTQCGYRIVSVDTFSHRVNNNDFFALPPRYLSRLDALFVDARKSIRARLL